MNQKEIALEIGMHPSTISREFNNDKVRAYSAKIAQVISTKKHKEKSKRFSKPIEKYIRVKARLLTRADN